MSKLALFLVMFMGGASATNIAQSYYEYVTSCHPGCRTSDSFVPT